MSGAGGSDREGLDRSLGLKEALTIGSGIMIGAGIFVFPGLAGGQAGPAAMASFGIGAVIALLITLPTAELATAMPRSGGGYTFVSRGLGVLPGALVGIGQWLGLIFASSFYLAGLGLYASDLAVRLGFQAGLPGPWVALVTGLALTGVAIMGTRSAGRLQDWVVGALLLLLTGFLGYGLMDATGVIGEATLPETFAPNGVRPIFGTAALVFTSYLGFQQIAVVSGEIREPARNLPRALMGSVILVGTLYILTMLVATSAAEPEVLAQQGETALAHVARTLLGPAGGLIVSAAGVLATVSSANASILSSSRVVFALGRDDLLPAGIQRVNHRFRTPHVALLLTGVPIAGIAVAGRIEVLAEVASTLHLVLFGLICVTLVVLRRRSPWWYQPSFRVPMGIPVAVLGGVASFGLIAFMGTTTLLIAGAVLLAAGAWYGVYGRNAEIPAPGAPRPLPVDRSARFLLATPVPDAPGLPDHLLDAFTGHAVVLLGWTDVPEQATPEQVRRELEGEVDAELERLAERLREAGIVVETDRSYTGDLVGTLEDAALGREVDVVVALRPSDPVRRILVPVPREDMAPGLARYSAWIAGHFGAEVHLLHREAEGPAVRRAFRSAGVAVARSTSWEGGGDAASAIVDAAESRDLLVMAESGPAEADEMFGGLTEQVLRESSVPVMVVRLPRLFAGDGDDPDSAATESSGGEAG